MKAIWITQTQNMIIEFITQPLFKKKMRPKVKFRIFCFMVRASQHLQLVRNKA